jgi:hypothetical protein
LTVGGRDVSLLRKAGVGRSRDMKVATMKPPAIFALQTERHGVVPNGRVAFYEEKLGAELGVSPEDVHLRTAGTTTPQGDSAED